MPGHDISERLVHELLVEQFPRWARLPVRAVAAQGWDNRTFRIGDDLAARLPSAEDYAAGILKEETVLPLLQGRMPVRIPEAVATGRPSPRFAWPWSVRRWLEGDTPDGVADYDRRRLARDLADCLTQLWEVPTGGRRWAGRHSSYRGCHPSAYSAGVHVAIDRTEDMRSAASSGTKWPCRTTSGNARGPGRCGRRSSSPTIPTTRSSPLTPRPCPRSSPTPSWTDRNHANSCR